MSQLPLTFSRREFIRDRVDANAIRFRGDFPSWLGENYPVWERFEREANAIYEAGHRHYSARTIGEVLRHHSALRAQNDGEYKLNDHRWPDLARLYLLMYPERQGFFELRRPEGRVAA